MTTRDPPCYANPQVIKSDLNTLTVAPPSPVDASPGVPETPGLFPETQAPRALCSWNSCSAGHQWPPVLALANCPGCQAPALAVQNQNCPWCNEPCVRTSLRSDFLVRGSGVAPRCLGQTPPGDTLDIELIRSAWSKSETTMKTFAEKTADEDAAWAASHL